MGSLGERCPKACLPIGDQPLILRHLAMFRRMGIDDIVVVVGFRAEEVQAMVAGGAAGAPGVRVRFVHQRARRGIAHAVESARDLVGDALVVVLSDTYFVPADLEDGVRRLAAGGLDAVLSIRTEPDADQIRRECSVAFDDAGHLTKIVEKPVTPFNDLKPCGLYFFTRAIFDAIDRTPPSAVRNEVELTDAIQTLVTMGRRVGRAHTIAWDRNLNEPRDLLACNLAFLQHTHRSTMVSDAAFVHPGAHLDQVVIGAGARVEAAVQLSRVVALPGARIVADAHDVVIGPDAIIEAA